MIKQFRYYRERIEKNLKDILSSKADELEKINPWGRDAVERLMRFSIQGKLLRGSLLLFSFHMFEKQPTTQALEVASAYELLHSFLLIHDDIMDRDTTRRGMPSIFYQYEELIARQKGPDPYHSGTSLGICTGDVTLFLSFEILLRAALDPAVKQRILLLWSRELEGVGIAQMQDVYFSSRGAEVEEEEILALYHHKTARYTFSVPLCTGALLADRNGKIVEDLEELGDCIGLIYQLKDDELGIFGNEEKLGKPVGTDVKERKKTLLFHYLGNMVGDEDKEKLDRIMKSPEPTPSDLQFIREAVQKTGAQERVGRMMVSLIKRAELLIGLLDVEKSSKTILSDILDYSLRREK